MLHLPLSSACRLVRILRSVVESLVLAMLNAGHDLLLCRAVAGKLVGDYDTGRPHLPLQQLAQQPLGRVLVASALDQDVEYGAGLVDGSPKPMLYPGNFQHDLVQMPFVANPRKAATDLVGKRVSAEARGKILEFFKRNARDGNILVSTQPLEWGDKDGPPVPGARILELLLLDRVGMGSFLLSRPVGRDPERKVNGPEYNAA